MANLANHILNKFLTDYGTREIAFNKSLIKFTGLETKKVFLKISGEQWSCVLYSCSMKSAKVIVSFDQKAFELLKKYKNMVNLRLSFLPSENKNSIVFFVPGIVKGYKNFFEKNNNVFLVTIEFTQRAPDDLIEILGKIIKEWEDFEKRKDVRINLEGKTINQIGLLSNKSVCTIENIKRPCIIKNISAGGTMLVISCVPKFVMNKSIEVILPVRSAETSVLKLVGNIKRYEDIQGRKDIYVIGVEFDKDKIPIEYKQLINNFLNMLETMDIRNKQ